MKCQKKRRAQKLVTKELDAVNGGFQWPWSAPAGEHASWAASNSPAGSDCAPWVPMYSDAGAQIGQSQFCAERGTQAWDELNAEHTTQAPAEYDGNE